MVPMNRRRMDRYDYSLPVRLMSAGAEAGGDTVSELKTKDICVGGAFLETETPLVPRSKVKMEITLPLDRLESLKSKTMLIEVCGEVVRCNKYGMALSFDKSYNYTSIV